MSLANAVASFVRPNKKRLLEVKKLSSEIFNTTFNPSGLRTGAKILKKPLKGPLVKDYYGDPSFPSFFTMRKLWRFEDLELTNMEEEHRLGMIDQRKKRGKGAPKKKSEATDKTKKKK
ncbi:unnamed protein product [Kuraishia capsulata CBS 1993]|uniref:Small ribosomal subunit protein mS33 n=1 Tax=Kuraishia capsulata CBS 1993 TaxID=1382522 RepID=W6MGZ6_9ASCO|nr:uncharacterized protein KUCA_T00000865001 [Kuraishia capsulata CBS 1993]CDK24898.1 unnamed protein product [Kuraishia capsulata CBS 1993]